MRLPSTITSTTIAATDEAGCEKMLMAVFSLLYQRLYTQIETPSNPRFVEEGDAYAAAPTLSLDQVPTRIQGNRFKMIAYIPVTATWLNSGIAIQNYVERIVNGDPL